MKKRKEVISNIVIGIIASTIIAFLTGCVEKTADKDKSAEELRNEYLNKIREEERIRRGQLTYSEALNAMFERHKNCGTFTDIFKFYEQGHYYKAFYRYDNSGNADSRVTNSSCGVVHDPNCPCFKNKLR